MNKKIIIISLFLLFIDLITKYLIDINFNVSETKEIIVDFFSLTKVYNTGASWNILSGARIILIVISILVLISLIYYQRYLKNNKRNTYAFSLLYSGIMGNLIERIVNGYVIDFLDFNIFGYDYPVFNFADIFIILGVILLSISIIKKEDSDESKE